MDYNKFVDILKSHGYKLMRQSKHLIYSNGKNTISVPKKHGNMNKFTAKRILKEAGIEN